MSGKDFPVVVIPTFNERENVTSLIRQIKKQLPKVLVVVVDDSSPDGTAELVEILVKKDKKLKLIKRKGKLGRGSAVLEGFQVALRDKKTTHLVEMDGDFSHDPSELNKMLVATGEGDMVIASRYLEKSKIVNWPIERKVFSLLANLFAKVVLGVPIRDYTNGYRCYKREVLEKIGLNQFKETGYALLMEMAFVIHKQGFKIAQVPTVFVNRRRGRSNTTLREILNALNAPLRIRFRHR